MQGVRTVRSGVPVLVVLAALVALPPVAEALDQVFYIGFASRVLIFALFASSLNLLIGLGGMLSFGHAAFFGSGAYTVAILAHELSLGHDRLLPGADAAIVVWPIAVGVSALLALVVGVCRRASKITQPCALNFTQGL